MIELALIGMVLTAYFLWKNGAGGQSDTIDDLGGAVDKSASPAVVRIAQAIATAEGFFVEGSRPARNHNPGDMTADLIGRSTGKDGNFVIFSNDSDGWLNLYAQINAWLEGTSRHATSGSSIFDISRFYTTTEQDIWASNVANSLGVDVDTPIGEIA